MEISKSTEGCVYILSSVNCDSIKIGGTNYAPLKRIKEINSAEPYKSHGPWTLHDFRQVADWRTLESSLHFIFRGQLNTRIRAQKELFAISPHEASSHLAQIDEAIVLKKPKVDRLFQEHEFSQFLAKLFRFTGLLNWLDLQGAWTFSLFPATNGGRYYTLNIGSHEVAFATTPAHNQLPVHMLHMDKLIYDFKEVSVWLKKHKGSWVENNYASALPRSTSMTFEGNFDTALAFLNLKGVRRAIIAYWTEALLELQEQEVLSLHAKNHNWNAVAELKKRMLSGKL